MFSHQRHDGLKDLLKKQSSEAITRLRKGRYWDELREYQKGESQSRILFTEFVEVFKGERQLFWSKNLKRMFGLDEADDKDYAEKMITLKLYIR